MESKMVVVFGVFVAVFVQCVAAQTVHVVGDSLGWTIPQSGQQYVTWASANKFAVGDFLIFNFATNAHDVQQVPNKFFSFQQKLAITVSAAAPGASPSGPTSAPPPPPPPTTPPTTSITVIKRPCCLCSSPAIVTITVQGWGGPPGSCPPPDNSSSLAVVVGFSLSFLSLVILGTIEEGLIFHKSTDFTLWSFSDADWASSVNDRRSTIGACIFFGHNLLTWTAKKLSIVSRSSTEAEHRALAHTALEIRWFGFLFRELDICLRSAPCIYVDNLSAIYMAANPIFHARTRHIEVDYHFVRELVA
ncbi:hypothetical protein L3X38_016622 [Prunus dulcis]|uniref:Phytocyanin domain-containing protein n=1 Tax=Prunus dulcis TaxID=3755 RepID=A0AAD4W862_PRUDU|nr:hypothetical protein L3X38_016622 [Prunus dulcis]